MNRRRFLQAAGMATASVGFARMPISKRNTQKQKPAYDPLREKIYALTDENARLFSISCAIRVWPIYEAAFPGDYRPRWAIVFAWLWTTGWQHSTIEDLKGIYLSANTATSQAMEKDRKCFNHDAGVPDPAYAAWAAEETVCMAWSQIKPQYDAWHIALLARDATGQRDKEYQEQLRVADVYLQKQKEDAMRKT